MPGIGGSCSQHAAFRAEYEAISADYFEDNAVQQGYLST
jgi:hypothetical protein